jgi:hypothetical protein
MNDETATLEYSALTDGSATASPAGHSSTLLQPSGLNLPIAVKKAGVLPCELFVKIDARNIMPLHLVDAANFLQHRIIVNQQYNHADETIRGVTHRYTNLKAAYLRKIIGTRLWKPLINEAIRIGLIERRYYIPEEQSFGYRIGDAYADRPITIVEPGGKRIRRRILAFRHDKAEHKLRDKTYRKLLDWLGQVSIPLKVWPEIQEQGYARHLAKGGKLSRPEYFDYVQTTLLAIQRRQFRLGVDHLGRIQSTATTLIKPARKHLTIQGQHLVEIDIRNSQPVFMTLMLLKQFQPDCPEEGGAGSMEFISSKDITKGAGFKELETYTSSNAISYSFGSKMSVGSDSWYLSVPTVIDTRLMMSGLTQESGCQDVGFTTPEYPADVEKWLRLVESGNLYDELMREMGWAPDRRDEFKSNEFFSVLYGNPTNFGWRKTRAGSLLPPSELKPILAKNYPTVWAFIVAYYNRFGHGELSREMQRQESRLMILGVCGKLVREYPECPIVTVHDAILTPQPWVETVSTAIKL